MKIKYYLRGLGTGIIFTAIVLMIIYSYRTTDSKTMDRARELGVIMPGETSREALKDNEKDTEKNSADDITKEVNTGNNDDNTSGSQDSSETPEPTSQNNGGEENTTTNSPANEPSTKEPPTDETTTERQTEPVREITFTISGGMYSETVSQRLNELGVIDNAAEFNRYLVDNGYAGRIRIGTYTFTTGMSYADVAAIISR